MAHNQGINIGGDGMGGRRGASRQWGFGDDSDGEENAPRYVTKGGNRAPSSTQAGTSNPPSAAPMAMQKGEGLVVGRGGRNGMKGGLGVEIGGDMNGKGNNMDTEEHRKIYEKGLQMRTQVLGEQYVNKSLRETEGNEFMRPFVQFATEAAWSTIWTRPGLDLKTRSLLNLVMLTALGKSTELATHVRGAVRNGASEVEIREALLQATAYCGMPAGMEAFRVADKVLKDLKVRGEL